MAQFVAFVESFGGIPFSSALRRKSTPEASKTPFGICIADCCYIVAKSTFTMIDGEVTKSRPPDSVLDDQWSVQSIFATDDVVVDMPVAAAGTIRKGQYANARRTILKAG